MGRKTKYNWGKLGGSLVVDAIGMVSMIFGISEIIDLVWAPIHGIILNKMYHNNALTILGVGEEILPFTDIIPTATIGWLNETFKVF